MPRTSVEQFVNRRRLIIRWSAPLAVFLLATTVAGYVFLWIRSPLLANPTHALAKIQAGDIPENTLRLLAAMCPICFLTTWFLIGLLAVLLLAFINVEKRYLLVIEKLHPPNGDEDESDES